MLGQITVQDSLADSVKMCRTDRSCTQPGWLGRLQQDETRRALNVLGVNTKHKNVNVYCGTISFGARIYKRSMCSV